MVQGKIKEYQNLVFKILGFSKKQISWLKNSDEKHQWIDVDYDIQDILKNLDNKIF